MSDAEAKARRSGYDVTVRGKVLFAVALVRSNAERTYHVMTHLVPRIPNLIIFNATEKNNPAQMEYDYRSLGMKMRSSFSGGEAAWWITEMRFYQMLLASDYNFGVILQDDAQIKDDFVARVEDLISGLTPQELRVGYRLGSWDYGLLIPRRAVPRIVGTVCSDTVEWPTDSYSFKHVGCCQLFFDARPYNLLVEQADEIPSQISFHSNARINAMGLKQAFIPPDAPADRMKFGNFVPFCEADYPGKIKDPRDLAVRFDPANDLRLEYNLMTHQRALS